MASERCSRQLFGLSNPESYAPRLLFSARLGTPINLIDPFAVELAKDTFEVNRSSFFSVARANRPTDPVARASSFSAWVHSLYAPLKEKSELKEGLLAEQRIFDQRNAILRSEKVWINTSGDWELEYNGLHLKDQESSRPSYFEIPELRVSDQPLRASPDQVYRNERSKAVIIVEIKFTTRPIPYNLWPNIWAQLWAYSKIPGIADSPSIYVVGEIWGDHHYMHRERLRDFSIDTFDLSHSMYLRSIVRRDPTMRSFDAFFQTLFDIYSNNDRRQSDANQ